MFSALTSSFVGYLAAAGLVTNAAVVGRGLIGSVRLAAQGRFSEAGVQALAAVAAPAVMAQAATVDLLAEVIDTARDLAGQTLDAALKLYSDKAA
jgi:hypothetical protein